MDQAIQSATKDFDHTNDYYFLLFNNLTKGFDGNSTTTSNAQAITTTATTTTTSSSSTTTATSSQSQNSITKTALEDADEATDSSGSDKEYLDYLLFGSGDDAVIVRIERRSPSPSTLKIKKCDQISDNSFKIFNYDLNLIKSSSSSSITDFWNDENINIETTVNKSDKSINSFIPIAITTTITTTTTTTPTVATTTTSTMATTTSVASTVEVGIKKARKSPLPSVAHLNQQNHNHTHNHLHQHHNEPIKQLQVKSNSAFNQAPPTMEWTTMNMNSKGQNHQNNYHCSYDQESGISAVQENIINNININTSVNCKHNNKISKNNRNRNNNNSNNKCKNNIIKTNIVIRNNDYIDVTNDDNIIYNCNAEKPWICKNCNRGYKWRNSLTCHQKNECGKPPKFFCTKLCGYRTNIRSNLKRHLKTKCSGKEKTTSSSPSSQSMATTLFETNLHNRQGSYYIHKLIKNFGNKNESSKINHFHLSKS